MSFKIFYLQLLGKIKPAGVIEKKRKDLYNDYEDFLKVESSEDLKVYLELENFINSAAFKAKKAELDALQFKGSRQFNQFAEFEGLKKKPALKNFFKITGTPELKRFDSIANSEKLKEFDELQDYVKGGQFEKEKQEIKQQVFKGSVEEKHWFDFKRMDKSAEIKVYKLFYQSETLKSHETFAKSDKLRNFVTLRNSPENDKQKINELKKLKRDVEIKNYFKLEKSRKIKLYRETVDSHHLKRYLELKELLQSKNYKRRETFLKDKTKFDKSEAFKKYKRYKDLVADSDIKFFLKFEKSGLYKNYLDVAESFELKRYFELEEIIKSKEFKAEKAYLEDKKKWEKTDEYARQQKFIAMKELPHFVKYFKYKNTNIFDFFRNWKIVFEDEFSSAKLDTEKWSVKSYVAEKLLGDNYSMPGDLNVFTDGRNINTGGKLSITVKKENSIAKVWQMPAGFMPRELNFTSGLISSWRNFWMNDGILEAKIYFNPVKQVVSSFWLSGEKNTPRINLLEMGTKNRLGISTLNGSGSVEFVGIDISSLNKKKPYIFTVEKNAKNITWKINDVLVFDTSYSAIEDSLHLNASSLVVYDLPSSVLPVNFEIEWVKCYQKKQN